MYIRKSSEFKSVLIKIVILFVTWRFALFMIAFLSPFFIKEFGGRFPYVHILINTNLPYWIWGFGNFDGVHYLTIALSGYSAQFTQAFFPLYPLLIRGFSFGDGTFLSGIILSNILFIAGLIMLYKLFRLDFEKDTSFRALVLLVAFPTAFYFGSLYSESLFLFLVTTSLFFIRTKQFLLAGLFAGFASATRVLGLFLLPVLLIEAYIYFKAGGFNTFREKLEILLGIIFAPLGTFIYMLYLQINFNNALYFLSAQPAFGAERSDMPFILLPQVIYRYIKIFLTVPIESAAFFTAFLEFTFTVLPLSLLLILIKKIRFSYVLFTIGVLIMPTLTGTLSSMPRYALMGFLLLPLLAVRIDKLYWVVLTGFVLLQGILLALFIRGNWVA